MPTRRSQKNAGRRKLHFESLESRRLLTTSAGCFSADCFETPEPAAIFETDTPMSEPDVGVDGNILEIGDLVWLDATQNGIQERWEEGRSGVTVKLYKVTDQQGQPNSQITLQDSTTTDDGGGYHFYGVEPGKYMIEVAKPEEFQSFTNQNVGSDATTDSNVDRETGKSEIFEIVNQSNLTIDAGLLSAAPAQPYVDLDTDSNNNGKIEGDEGEDLIESYTAKRTFVNEDDDNRNGKADVNDGILYDMSGKKVADNDLIELHLKYSLDLGTGEELLLQASEGLKLFADKYKTPLAWHPSDLLPASAVDSWYAYSADNLPPDAVFAEGRTIGENYTVRWLWARGTNETDSTPFLDGIEVVDSDTVMISVEDVIWPFPEANDDAFNETLEQETDEQTGWVDGNTSEWIGLELGKSWYIDKALVDFIMTPSDQGSIETIHPELLGEKTGQFVAASIEGEDAKTTEPYPNDITLTLEFEFEDKRGGNGYGYVQAQAAPPKLSFVGNSGVKFVTPNWRNGEGEITILDMKSMLALAGVENQLPLDDEQAIRTEDIREFPDCRSSEIFLEQVVWTDMRDYMSPAKTHEVACHFAKDSIYTLMNNWLYDGIPENVLVNSGSVDGIPELNNLFSDSIGSGKLVIIFHNDTVVSVINLGVQGQPFSTRTFMVARAADTKINLQSHWGSAVKFTSMSINPIDNFAS